MQGGHVREAWSQTASRTGGQVRTVIQHSAGQARGKGDRRDYISEFSGSFVAGDVWSVGAPGGALRITTDVLLVSAAADPRGLRIRFGSPVDDVALVKAHDIYALRAAPAIAGRALVRRSSPNHFPLVTIPSGCVAHDQPHQT
jgi:hypothetical protein